MKRFYTFFNPILIQSHGNTKHKWIFFITFDHFLIREMIKITRKKSYSYGPATFDVLGYTREISTTLGTRYTFILKYYYDPEYNIISWTPINLAPNGIPFDAEWNWKVWIKFLLRFRFKTHLSVHSWTMDKLFLLIDYFKNYSLKYNNILFLLFLFNSSWNVLQMNKVSAIGN